MLAQSLSAVGRQVDAKKAVDKVIQRKKLLLLFFRCRRFRFKFYIFDAQARPIFEHNHPKGHANLGIVAAVAAQIAEGSGEYENAIKFYKEAFSTFNNADVWMKVLVVRQKILKIGFFCRCCVFFL